jgi:hypothetical protein
VTEQVVDVRSDVLPEQLPEPLHEARARLVGVDEVSLDQHPGEFTAIDGLLRAALDAADGGAEIGR